MSAVAMLPGNCLMHQAITSLRHDGK